MAINIKPINEGSSVHVYICTKKNIIKNLKALSVYNQIFSILALNDLELGAITQWTVMPSGDMMS